MTRDDSTPCRLAALTAAEVAARRGAPVLLPMGSTETHGPALPMGDHLLAEAIAMRIAGRHGTALVAPVLPFGGADFFGGVPGAIALSHATLAALLREVLEGLAAGGFARVLIVNGHGGSIPAIEEAQRAAPVPVPALHIWRVAGAWQTELGGPATALGHGGDPVASAALHLFPGLCRPGRLAPGRPAGAALGVPLAGFGAVRLAGAEFNLPTPIETLAPGGVQAADPRGASAERGAVIVERLALAGAAMLHALEAHVA